jgi:hypothetical protein
MDPNARDGHDGPIRYGDETFERRRHVPKHAASPLEAARSVAAVVTVAALILVGFFAWREWSLTSNARIALTKAAREGARLDSLGEPNVVAETQAATGLGPVHVTVAACSPGAGPTAKAVVIVSYKGSGVPLTARAVMPCET